MPIAFMLALQASGMVVDYFGRQDQARLSKMGAQVENASINSNIASSRLATEDESLQSMRQLRQNLGTQAAMLAGRGASSASGSSVFGMNESVGNFNADQRMRVLNQKTREADLKAGKLISNLHDKASQSKIWNDFASNSINRIPTSKEAWSQIKSGFGFTKVNA